MTLTSTVASTPTSECVRAAPAPLRGDLVALALALGTLMLHLHLLRTQAPSYAVSWVYLDEGYRLYPGLRVMRGESLFRDVWAAYPPLSFYLHALAFKLFGVTILAIRLLLVMTQTVTTLLTYAVARRLMNRWFSVFAALLTIIFGIVHLNMGYAGWYVVPFTISTVLFLFRYVESDCNKRGNLTLAGFLAGLAVGMKLKDGILIIVASVVAIVAGRILADFEPGRGRPSRFHVLYLGYLPLPAVLFFMLRGTMTTKGIAVFLAPNVVVCAALLLRQICFSRAIHPQPTRLIAEIAAFMSGCVAATLPWVWYYSALLGPSTLWYWLAIVPTTLGPRMVYWARDFDPSGVPSWLAAAGLLLAVTVALCWNRRRRLLASALTVGLAALPVIVFHWPRVFAASLALLLPFTTGIALLFACVHWRQPDAAVHRVAILAVFNSTIGMALYPWVDFNHWLWVCGVAFVILAFAAARVHGLLVRTQRGLGWIVYATQCALLVVLLPAEFYPLRAYMPTVALQGSASGDLVDPRSARELQPLVDFINKNVPPDGHILEIPTSLYAFIAGRRQAARLDYFSMLDGRLWDERLELEHIKRNNPEYAFVRDDLGWFLGWRRNFPQLERYLGETFVPHAQFGPVQVLRRREAH